MNLVSLEKVTKRHVDRLVLDEATLGIDEGDRVGVIGVNGSGKSTLLKLVGRVEQPDAGKIVHAGRLRIDYVAQAPSVATGQTALDAVFDVDGDLATTLRTFEWDLEPRATATLDRLGIRPAARPIDQMSGGERRRVALARALTHADTAAAVGEGTSLLILDEPTNHLDAEVIEWLETELRNRSGALLVVTHDRYLLDRIATRIVEVGQGRLHVHHGSYGDYLEARAGREERAAAEEHRLAGRARRELSWLRRNPAARTTKAKARVDQAHALLGRERHEIRPELAIDLPARRIGGKVVNLHNVGKQYGGRWIVRGVDHRLSPGERLGLVGPNASGKTTLLRLVAGREEPDEGSVRLGETVHPGWYGQDPQPLPARMRVLDAVKEVVLETNTVQGITLSAAQLLERFLFPPASHRAYVGELSGGERRRLELLRVLATAPNLLLLDEPTNDLDLDVLAVLEDYLDTWPGTLVVASHDRFFLDRVCGHLFSLEPSGSVRDHPGGWEAYRTWRQEAEVDEVPRAAGGRGRGKPRQRKLSYNERRELAGLDERITQLERRRDELTDAVSRGTEGYAAAQQMSEELTGVFEQLEAAETRWLELAEIQEATTA